MDTIKKPGRKVICMFCGEELKKFINLHNCKMNAKCLRCGRILTAIESIKRGYGSFCWSKIQKLERLLGSFDDYQIKKTRMNTNEKEWDEETKKKFYENLSNEDKELFKQCWCDIRIFRKKKLIQKLNEEDLSDIERRMIKDTILKI